MHAVNRIARDHALAIRYEGSEIVVKQLPATLHAVRDSGGWWSTIREPFTGAWQRNIECETPQNILAFSAVYACVSLIAGDISKLRLRLVQEQSDGTWQEVKANSPFKPVLRKPNRYQTRQQFISQWLTLKLLRGNAYILKERDNRGGGKNNGVVVGLYVLDSRRVTPLVAEDGSVYYRLDTEALSGLKEQVTVPASEIIHDRMMCPWHPLVGVSPIFAAGAAATQGIRIQAMSARFFENMSRPSGMLTAPGHIQDDTALRMKTDFERNFAGGNIGRLFVAGDGLKYDAFTMPFVDAQLIEQLKWTREDVAAPFHMPQYKLGGPLPTFNNAGVLNQEYYSQCLQEHMEAIEVLMDEGLGLGESPNADIGTEFDTDGLLRMDPLSRAETASKLQGVAKINELRLRENYPPVEGGDTVYLQQQEFSLAALAKRDASPDPFKTAAPAAPATPAPAAIPEPAPAKDAEIIAREFTESLIAKFSNAPAYA